MTKDNPDARPGPAAEPRFLALCRREYIEADDTLACLLAVLQELADPTVPEDVVVWDGFRAVCLVRPGGATVWLLPEPAACGKGCAP